MKTMKKGLAVIIALVLVLGMSVSAFAASVANEHTITIQNDDQNVDHTYEAYQIFTGNLNAAEDTLSDIAWGTGVDGDALLTALKASTNSYLLGDNPSTTAVETDWNLFSSCVTAQDVAKVLANFASTASFTVATATLDGTTENAGAIDAVADIIANCLKASGKVSFTKATTTPHITYTATVPSDGYYFIKDTTTTLVSTSTSASDTLSKYMLTIIRDETIIAKDTGLIPNKQILGGSTHLAADSAAIGDTVTFEVTVQVPNTRKYDSFYFEMQDQLPVGITFTGITSVKVDTVAVADLGKADPQPTFDNTYDGSNGYYALKINDTAPTITSNKYPWEADNYDAVAEEGGQKVSLEFKEFKKFVEKNSLIGKTVTVTYTGVVNDDAVYQGTGNENEVKFVYSNDPNNSSVHGTTPGSKTRTYTTSLKVFKVDENGNKVATGATFELKGDSLNRTVLTGYRFVETSYTPVNGEVIDSTASYWKLLDGSYTTTDPATVANTTQYASTTTKYYKVTYTLDEVATVEKDIVLITDSEGVAEFVGLGEGEFTLEEIAAPDGFNKIDGKATITVTWYDPEGTKPTSFTDAEWDTIKAQGGFVFSVVSENGKYNWAIAWNGTDKQFEVTVVNVSGSLLPATGGIGTTIFYVVGAVLVIGAAIVLVTRRRMSSNE